MFGWEKKRKRHRLQSPGAVLPWPGWHCPQPWDQPQPCCPLKRCPSRPPRVPRPRRGRLAGQELSLGIASFHIKRFWGEGEEIKGFSLHNYSENALQSVRAHGRGGCQEVLASRGKVLHPGSHCSHRNAPRPA